MSHPWLVASLAALSFLQTPQQGAAPAAPAASEVLLRPYILDNRVDAELRLPDLDGKEHKLFAENPGQAIVLVFWGYRDPIALGYASRIAELAKTYAGRAAFYLVDSNYDELVSAGDALAKLREVVAREKVTLPVLIDKDNLVADDFRALTNSQVFLIDVNHYLRYHGGVDDDPRGERAKNKTPIRTWLDNALKTILAGNKLEENFTQATGRAIKRTPKAGAAPAPAPAPAKPK